MDVSSVPSHFQLAPAALHPAAAASFTDILQCRLRSVLFAIRFRTRYRGLAEFPSRQGYQYHFAQTFPLARRDHPAGAFHWLEADPRPGVEIDIQQLPLGQDPQLLARGWKQLEQAFGITRPRSSTSTSSRRRATRPEPPGCAFTSAPGLAGQSTSGRSCCDGPGRPRYRRRGKMRRRRRSRKGRARS
jgi:hypothetical protein